MRRFLPLILAPVTALAVFAGGVYLGDSRAQDPTPQLAEGEPVAVTPVRSEPPVPLDEDGYPVEPDEAEGTPGVAEGESAAIGGDGATGQAEGSPFALVPGTARVGADTDAGPTGTDTTAEGDGPDVEPEREGAPPFAPVEDPAGGEPGDDEPRLRFTDPCAGPIPGESGGDDCPEGMGGSILLDDDLPTAPSLAIVDPWMGPVFVGGAENRCPVGVDPDGTVHAFVLTNVPATLTLTLDVRGEHHEVVAETGPEERFRFTGQLLDGVPTDGSQVNGVQTCVTFESLPRSLRTDGPAGEINWYEPAVTGVDDLGNEISHPAGFLQMRVRDDEGYLDEFADDADGTAEAEDVDFAAGSVHFSRWGGVSPRCRRLGPHNGRLHGTLLTTAPGTFDLAVIDRGERIEVGNWTTPAAEVRLHEELVRSGEAPATSGPGAVQTCFNMSGVDNPGHYYLEISGTTESGEPASDRVPFTITESLADQLPSETAGRPRTMATRDGEQVNILVTYDDDEEQVIARGLPRNGPRATGEDCTSLEAATLRNPTSDPYLDLTASPISRTVFDLFGGSPGADSRFDMVQPIRVTPGEGGVIDVCVWIYTKPSGDFDPTVEQREQLHVESPRNLRISIDLQYLHASSIDLFGPDSLLPTEARRYRVTALNWPGQPARMFPPSDLAASGSWYGDCGSRPRCAEPSLTLLTSGDNRIPDLTHLRLEEPEHGHVVDVMLPTPNSCMVGRPSGVGGPVCSLGVPEEHYIDLPDNEGTWCITDCHGRRFIQVVVRPEVGPGGPPGTTPRADDEGWVVRNEGSFDRTTLSLPATPRVDLSVNTPTATLPGPGHRPTGTLVLPFDRPMDVTVTPVLHEPIPETCSLPAEQSSASPLARHTFVFPGLCFGAHYTFDVTALDPVGGGRLDLPGAAFTLLTPSYPLRSITVEMVMSGTESMDRRDQWTTVRLGSNSLELEGASSLAPCLEPAVASEHTGEMSPVRGTTVALGDHSTIAIEIQWETCTGGMSRLDASRTISIADVLAGPITYTAGNDNITAEVTLTATPIPGYPLP